MGELARGSSPFGRADDAEMEVRAVCRRKGWSVDASPHGHLYVVELALAGVVLVASHRERAGAFGATLDALAELGATDPSMRESEYSDG